MHLVDYTNDKKFLVSAGGRAEFKIWLLNFNALRNVISVSEVASKMLKGNDKQRQKSWKVIKSNNQFQIFQIWVYDFTEVSIK